MVVTLFAHITLAPHCIHPTLGRGEFLFAAPGFCILVNSGVQALFLLYSLWHSLPFQKGLCTAQKKTMSFTQLMQMFGV